MSIITLVSAAGKAFSEWRQREQAYGDFLALNDHELAYLGLHRSQIPLLFAGECETRHPPGHSSAPPTSTAALRRPGRLLHGPISLNRTHPASAAGRSRFEHRLDEPTPCALGKR
jgi:uncharacterized protein YjiS (DUF1127 family)